MRRVLWVKLPVMERIFGYTPNALRLKIGRKELTKDYHWKHAPDGRLVMSPRRFNEWLDR